jgi:hypothetical protein
MNTSTIGVSLMYVQPVNRYCLGVVTNWSASNAKK